MEQFRVDFHSLGGTQVTARGWYDAVRVAAVKLGLEQVLPMQFIRTLATVRRVGAGVGRPKKFKF